MLDEILHEIALDYEKENSKIGLDARRVGRPRKRGLKPKTPSALISGAKRTKIGQWLKKTFGTNIFEVEPPQTLTRPFTLVNTETGATITGEIVEHLKDEIIPLTPVSSSNVKGAGVFHSELLVQFHPSRLIPQRTYRYRFETPEAAEEAYRSLTSSPSPGRWVWHNIRGHEAGAPITKTKIGPSLKPPGLGIPTIGGTRASLVPYYISNRIPVPRVREFDKIVRAMKRNTSNPNPNPNINSRIEALLGARMGFRELGIRNFRSREAFGLPIEAGDFEYECEYLGNLNDFQTDNEDNSDEEEYIDEENIDDIIESIINEEIKDEDKCIDKIEDAMAYHPKDKDIDYDDIKKNFEYLLDGFEFEFPREFEGKGTCRDAIYEFIDYYNSNDYFPIYRETILTRLNLLDVLQNKEKLGKYWSSFPEGAGEYFKVREEGHRVMFIELIPKEAIDIKDTIKQMIYYPNEWEIKFKNENDRKTIFRDVVLHEKYSRGFDKEKQLDLLYNKGNHFKNRIKKINSKIKKSREEKKKLNKKGKGWWGDPERHSKARKLGKADFENQKEYFTHDFICMKDFEIISGHDSDFNDLFYGNDFTILRGPLTRAGPFEYKRNGKEMVLYKDWDNLVKVHSKQKWYPVKATYDSDGHNAEIKGYATNFYPNHETKQIYGEVILFDDLKEAFDNLKKSKKKLPREHSVSIGFKYHLEDRNKQIIDYVDHLAVSLLNKDKDRCSTLNGLSCKVSMINN